jgi:hypothetical protein
MHINTTKQVQLIKKKGTDIPAIHVANIVKRPSKLAQGVIPYITVLVNARLLIGPNINLCVKQNSSGIWYCSSFCSYFRYTYPPNPKNEKL